MKKEEDLREVLLQVLRVWETVRMQEWERRRIWEKCFYRCWEMRDRARIHHFSCTLTPRLIMMKMICNLFHHITELVWPSMVHQPLCVWLSPSLSQSHHHCCFHVKPWVSFCYRHHHTWRHQSKWSFSYTAQRTPSTCAGEDMIVFHHKPPRWTVCFLKRPHCCVLVSSENGSTWAKRTACSLGSTLYTTWSILHCVWETLVQVCGGKGVTCMCLDLWKQKHLSN